MVSLGLVLVTMTAVAIVAHALIGFPWAAAFALGDDGAAETEEPKVRRQGTISN